MPRWLVALQIGNDRYKATEIVLEHSHCHIAARAKQSPDNASFVAVVNCESAYLSVPRVGHRLLT